MPNGMTQEQMVEKIFDEIKDAKHSRKGLYEKFDEMKNQMVTKAECQTTRKNVGDRKDKTLMRLKDLALLVAALAAFLWGSGVLSR